MVQNGMSIQISQDYSSMVNFARCKCLGANVLRGPNQIPWDGKLEYDYQLWIDNDIVFDTNKFWQLCDLALPADSVDEEGNVLEFKEIMPRIHGKTEAVRNRVAIKAIVFDILTYNGQDTYSFGYGTRLETLQMHFPNVNITETKLVSGEEAIRKEYTNAIKAGYEGLVLKKANQVYEPGKRSWLKHKPALVDLDCEIMDATMGSGKRAGHYGSYLIGVRIDGELTPVGSVGTGFSDEDLLRLTRELRPLVERFETPTYHFLPRVVLEVSADLVTRDASNNIGLRFPRCKRIRRRNWICE